MIPTGHADGHGANAARRWNITPPKRMSVGVKKARAASNPCAVDKPAPSEMATNGNPIRVAPAEAAVVAERYPGDRFPPLCDAPGGYQALGLNY